MPTPATDTTEMSSCSRKNGQIGSAVAAAVLSVALVPLAVRVYSRWFGDDIAVKATKYGPDDEGRGLHAVTAAVRRLAHRVVYLDARVKAALA